MEPGWEPAPGRHGLGQGPVHQHTRGRATSFAARRADSRKVLIDLLLRGLAQTRQAGRLPRADWCLAQLSPNPDPEIAQSTAPTTKKNLQPSLIMPYDVGVDTDHIVILARTLSSGRRWRECCAGAVRRGVSRRHTLALPIHARRSSLSQGELRCSERRPLPLP